MPTTTKLHTNRSDSKESWIALRPGWMAGAPGSLPFPTFSLLLLLFRACLLAGALVLGPLAQAALVITPTFDSSITNDPNTATIISTINDTLRVYQTRFTDPINVTIKFQKMTTGLGNSQWWFVSIPYS